MCEREASLISPPEDHVGSSSFEFCAWGSCCSDLQWCLFSVYLTIGLQKTISFFPSLSRTLWTPKRQMLFLSCDFLKTACQAVISLISSPVRKESTITLEKNNLILVQNKEKISLWEKKRCTETEESSLKTPTLMCVKGGNKWELSLAQKHKQQGGKVHSVCSVSMRTHFHLSAVATGCLPEKLATMSEERRLMDSM